MAKYRIVEQTRGHRTAFYPQKKEGWFFPEWKPVTRRVSSIENGAYKCREVNAYETYDFAMEAIDWHKQELLADAHKSKAEKDSIVYHDVK